jgi:hypothetical protein
MYYRTFLHWHPVALEPDPLHESIELIKREELHTQLTGALLPSQPKIDTGSKVFLELSPQVGQVRGRNTTGTTTCDCSTWNTGLPYRGLKLPDRPLLGHRPVGE